MAELDVSSTSDVNLSDLDSEDLPDTPNTSDMKFSDEDSILSSSSDSVRLLICCYILFRINHNAVTIFFVFQISNVSFGIDDSLSISETEYDGDNVNINDPTRELDAVSLSSSVTSVDVSYIYLLGCLC